MEDNRREIGIDSLDTEDISMEEFKEELLKIIQEIKEKKGVS